MQRVRDSVAGLGNVAKFNADMLDIFVASAVNMYSDIVTKDKKVNHLEEKLGTIHTVDFKAQQSAVELRRKLDDLRQEDIEYRENAEK